jgi:hypothetical protein
MEDMRFWGILFGIVFNLVGLGFTIRKQGIQNGQLIQQVKSFGKFIEDFDSIKFVDEERLREKQMACRSEVDHNINTCRLELNNEISLMRKDLSALVEITTKAEKNREKHSDKNEKRWEDLQTVLVEIARK